MTDICATDLRFIRLISSRRYRNVQYEIVPGKSGLRTAYPSNFPQLDKETNVVICLYYCLKLSLFSAASRSPHCTNKASICQKTQTRNISPFSLVSVFLSILEFYSYTWRKGYNRIDEDNNY